MSEETKVTSSTSCSVNVEEDDWKEEELEEQFVSGRVSPTFITVENEKGILEQVQVTLDEDDFTKPNGSFFNKAFQRDPDHTDGNFFTRNGSIPNTKYIKDLKKNSKRRIVSKSGDCNTQLYRVSRKKRKFLKDVFTTMVDMQWRFTLLAFVASFLVSWFLFACVWWLISYVHGDYVLENINNNTFTPCILANKNFASAFLFSVETQHTIGYGSRQTTEECPEGIILQCVQSIVGVIIQACMAGIVFAKLARPKSRTKTVVFSKSAVVTQRNGNLFLLFRVGNVRSSHLLESHVRAQLIQKVVTDEGENIFFHQHELKVGTQLDGGEDRVLLLWPVTVGHLIDKTSPLWNLSPRDLLNSNFEIVVSLEGSIEATGSTTQARSSYLPNEILWGHRFEPHVSYAKQQGVYAVDCSGINRVVQDNTPRISAAKIQMIRNRKSSVYSVSHHQLPLVGMGQDTQLNNKKHSVPRHRHSVPARYGSASQIQSLPGLLDQEGQASDGSKAHQGDQEKEDDHSHRL